MKKLLQSNLLLYFASIVFAIMAVTCLITMALVYLLFHSGYLMPKDATPLAPIFFLLIISVVIGTVISVFVAQKILKPISAFSRVSHQVAAGNFDIRLADTSHIKEIHELTQNFNTMIQELSGIETLRSDFVVNVSHEFKTPIAAIEGYATLLQDSDLSDAERDEYTKMIIESSRQLSSLTGNILQLSKLENQEMLPEKKPFRLDEQIRQAILCQETQWSAKNIDLQIKMQKAYYDGNERLLMQVWMNLIGNAIKYTASHGVISVKLKQEKEKTIVSISDNGCGMEPAVMRHIFDKFYQGDTSRKSEGNGLGLTLSKQIVQRYGGELTAASQKGEGSTFTVVLPHTN